jgi:carbamoyltransferase
VKHDARFPENAIRYCLAEGGATGSRLDGVVFYDKPLLKFHRLLETYLSVAPSGLRPFMQAVPVWLREKLWIEPEIRESLERCGAEAPDELWFPEHHESHAASAFYPSPFSEAAVLTVDGVGEWATATLGVGEGHRLRLLEQISFPHSLGLLYSAFTYYAGFQVNDGEYKLMGLAPYGEPSYVDLIRERLIDIKEDGSFRLDMRYFGYLDDLVMTSARFEELLGRPPRAPGSPITREDMNLARSIQVVVEEILLRMARHARVRTGKRHLCLAGGVALNCVANGRILREGVFDDLWIQPAAGDAGGAVGAAYSVWHNVLGMPRAADDRSDRMRGACLGPEFEPAQIRAFLDARGVRYRELGEMEWAPTIAKALAEHEVVGLFQGRMEFGPRALGNRSILGDPRSPRMQSLMNRKIKFRESFRPFAPACLEERVAEYFELDRPSPYMLLVAPVRAIVCRARNGSDVWCSTPFETTRSKIPSRKQGRNRFICTKRARPRSFSRAKLRPRRSEFRHRSAPYTVRFAMDRKFVSCPVPQPTSSTRAPGGICSSRSAAKRPWRALSARLAGLSKSS